MLLPLRATRATPTVGAKAERLRHLQSLGFTVPATYVIPWAIHARYLAGDAALEAQLLAALRALPEPAGGWAVRSSAEGEDGGAHSFAGQFRSVLAVRGAEGLAAAVRAVWDSAGSPEVRSYRERLGLGSGPVRMAVIVQEMVEPVISGVAFSKNPVTGMDEVVVEALPGRGDALVQEGRTPLRWVNKWGRWSAAPESGDIPLSLVEQVVAGARAIARRAGYPADLEWVSDGRALVWVQLRPITALDTPNIYSNRIAREVLPGIIRPLVWSINVPLVNSAWIALFTRLVGETGLRPEDLARPFGYRAYFNMGAIGRIFDALGMPRETLELLMGLEGGQEGRPRFRPGLRTLRHIPRMLGFAAELLGFERQIAAFLAEAEQDHRRAAAEPIGDLDAAALAARVDAHYRACQRAALMNVVGPLLMYAYNGLLRAQLRRAGVEGAEALLHQRGARADYAPQQALAELRAAALRLPEGAQAQLGQGDLEGLRGAPQAEGFVAQLDRFLERFGHFSDSGNDLSRAAWRERPALLARMILEAPEHVAGPQRDAPAPLPLGGLRGWALAPIYRRALRFQGHREAISYSYTRAYARLRPLLLALGARLAERGLIDDAEDCFYLEWPEVRGLAAGAGPASPRALVAERRAAIAAAADLALPELIYGEQLPPAAAAATDVALLRGIPTARGYYRGRVRVVLSVEQFAGVEPGAVIVIPYSDVSWTPLIARAGALVAESGGSLSHSSIVAREYAIPAVVSVADACRLLRDGQEVTIDGYAGEVHIHAEG